MYNEKILSELNNLIYLNAMKNSNVNVISKKNAFGDTVKFYAQINSEDVIEKISYKASGCTHFLVYCNYFCSLVEGKKIDVALKINAKKLEEFSQLDESKIHVIEIILNAFTLLIKKYRKGVEQGTILPIEVKKNDVENLQEVKVDTKKDIKEVSKNNVVEDKNLKETNKVKKPTKTEEVTKKDINQISKLKTENKKDKKSTDLSELISKRKINKNEVSSKKHQEEIIKNEKIQEKTIENRQIKEKSKSLNVKNEDIKKDISKLTLIINKLEKNNDHKVDAKNDTGINSMNNKALKPSDKKVEVNNKKENLASLSSSLHSLRINNEQKSMNKVEESATKKEIKSKEIINKNIEKENKKEPEKKKRGFLDLFKRK